MNIVVYLGANLGNDISFKLAIEELGAYIAKRNDTLVYGGSKTGLMGVLADSALSNNGKVIGIEPQMFMDAEFEYLGLTELIVTKDMPERKRKMMEQGDVFIAFPGGTGTLDEISEIMSLVSLKLSNAKCIFYNLNGYYEGIKDLINKMLKYEFSDEERLKNIYFANNINDIDKILNL